MKRSLISLLALLTFLVVTVTGIVIFFSEFDLKVIGLHAFMGAVFVLIIACHAANNFKPLKKYFKESTLWLALVITLVLGAIFWWQPKPIKALLGLSRNLGPALDRFELTDSGMIFTYVPDPAYKMQLSIRMASGFDRSNPPRMAIWLENQGAYHIKTLLAPEKGEDQLPYWSFKRQGWEKAKLEAKSEAEKAQEEELDLDAVSEATPNGSFDPADYILPQKENADDPGPYRLLIEINQPDDPHGDLADQPSLIYAVDIENQNPRTYQLLELVGYPELDEDKSEGDAAWDLFYVDDRFGSALNLIDSALLMIERK